MARENLMKAVQDLGWYLTPESVDEFLAEKPNLNASELIKKAQDSDLKNIGAKYLTEGVSGGKADTFEAKGVLQLVKLRNIGAPKENEHSHTAPALYKLTLTDGHLNVNCLALDGINKLNLQTPPGTKILLKGSVRIRSNLLLLNNQNTTVLGGHVDYLVVKWKANQELTNHVREKCMTAVPPPPWVSFGSRNKKVADQDIDTNKKALVEVEKKDEESSEFTQARQAALAEAMKAKLTITKTFTQQTVDRSAVVAVAATTASAKPDTESSRPMKGRRRRFNRHGDDDDDDYIDPRDKDAMAAAAAKPSALTLLDVFKTKIEIEEEPQAAASNPVTTREAERPTYSDRRQKYGRNRQPYNADNARNANTSNTNKQVYNPSDFGFELGDETNVKDSIRLERELKSSSAKASSNTANTQPSSSSNAIQHQHKTQNTNSYNNYHSQSDRQERSERGNNYNTQNYQNNHRQDNQRGQHQQNGNQNNRNQNRHQQPRRDQQQQSQFMTQHHQYYPNDQQYYYEEMNYNQQYSNAPQQAPFYPQQDYYHQGGSGGRNEANNYQGAQRSYKNNQNSNGYNNNNSGGGRVYTNSNRRNH